MGLSYYRLTSIDFDGYTETFYNNVVSVKVNTEKKFRVFPNPVSDGKMTVQINFDTTPDAEIHIYNCMGILLAKYEMTSPEMTIAVPSLMNGIYFVKFSSGQFSEMVRFVIASKN